MHCCDPSLLFVIFDCFLWLLITAALGPVVAAAVLLGFLELPYILRNH
jgi:hypothetical protein